MEDSEHSKYEILDYSVLDTDEEEGAELARLEVFQAEDAGLGTLSLVPSTSAPTKHESPTLPSTACDENDEDALELQKINSALVLNKTLSEKLKELEEVLVGRLSEYRERLAAVHKAVTSGEKPERPEVFRYVNCGKPYFRDESNFPAPPNEDTIIMAQSKMYDFSEITSVRRWTVNDKISLSGLLLKLTKKIRKDELKSKIAKIKREGKNKNPKLLKKRIAVVNKEIKALSTKTLKELALPLEHEYDWDLVASSLSKRHNASEYRALWKRYLHPSINKSVWSKSENTLLHEIAKKYEYQDWEAIAKELNTGRSGYQCFVNYRKNTSNTGTRKKWTKEEEDNLRRLISNYKVDDYIPWGKVASAMENRTKKQIYNKYLKFVEKRKGRFIPEEDAVILACIKIMGLNFKKIAEYIPGRSAAQIRLRYGVIGRKRTSAAWTIEEDRLLLQSTANDDMIINFSTVSKHFPGKTRIQTRNRYTTLINWMKAHPNRSVENAPRRAARCLNQGLPTENLNKALENLKKKIKMEVEISKIKSSITVNSPTVDIHDAILNCLITQRIKEEEARRAEMKSKQEVVDLNDVVPAQPMNIANVQKLLTFLKGTLNEDLIINSSLAEEYPELLKPKPKVNRGRIKTYSRKSPKTAVKVDEALDKGGDNNWGPSTYVLPPNSATITGRIRVEEYLNSMKKKAGQSINIDALMRCNPDLKSVMSTLMERFKTLFMSPMLLSHVDPEQIGKMLPKENISKSAACFQMPEWDISKSGDSKTINSHGFLVPQIPKVLAATGYNTTTIDLEEPNAEQKKETCVSNIVIGEKEIFVIEHKKSKYKNNN